jgi:hypothetical protein
VQSLASDSSGETFAAGSEVAVDPAPRFLEEIQSSVRGLFDELFLAALS